MGMGIMVIFAVTLAAFLLVMAGMAVGVMLGRREISGSCGGIANSEGETSCSLCSKPDAACRDLARSRSSEETSSRANSGCDASQPGHVERKSESVACEKDCQQSGCSKEAIDACKGR